LLLYTIYYYSTLISSVYLHQSSRIYNTGTIKVSLNHTLPISLCYSTHKAFKSHVKFSQADRLYSSVPLVPICSELTAHGSHYIAAERTWTYSKHISHDRYPASLLARRSDLQKTQLPILLRIGPRLQSCCLAICWSFPLQHLERVLRILHTQIISKTGGISSFDIIDVRYFGSGVAFHVLN
jgi:hypothetical protein